MANFKPSDFSNVQRDTDRPSKPGWYCAGHLTSDERVENIHAGLTTPHREDFSWWDGLHWFTHPGGVNYPFQDFIWFGLKAPA